MPSSRLHTLFLQMFHTNCTLSLRLQLIFRSFTFIISLDATYDHASFLLCTYMWGSFGQRLLLYTFIWPFIIVRNKIFHLKLSTFMDFRTISRLIVLNSQGRSQEFAMGDKTGGLGDGSDGSPPAGFRGRAPVEVWRSRRQNANFQLRLSDMHPCQLYCQRFYVIIYIIMLFPCTNHISYSAEISLWLCSNIS